MGKEGKEEGRREKGEDSSIPISTKSPLALRLDEQIRARLAREFKLHRGRELPRMGPNHHLCMLYKICAEEEETRCGQRPSSSI